MDADGLGRYSLAGCDPVDGLVWRRGDAGDPLSLLEAAQRRWSAGPVDDGPWPLAVGYLSYDLAREVLARAPLTAVDDLGLPEVDFARYPAVWRLDRATGKAAVLSHDGAAAERLLARLHRAAPPLPPLVLGAPRWVLSDEEYQRRVERVLEYLRAGDCYQVNLSHRLAADCDGALALYLRLVRAPARRLFEDGGVRDRLQHAGAVSAATRRARGDAPHQGHAPPRRGRRRRARWRPSWTSPPRTPPSI